MRTILVALDLSARAPAVLKAAQNLVRGQDAGLLLFTAVSLPPELAVDGTLVSLPNITQQLIDDASTALERLKASLDPAIPARTRVEPGVPWQAIVRVAAEENVELIIIGAHGYNFIERMLGTTAARVVGHADRNVLVVRPEETRA